MINIKEKELPKTKRVAMLWDEKTFSKAKKFAHDNNMSISELSRQAINTVLDNQAEK